MRARAAVLGGIAVAIGILPVWAEKPLKNYSFIKGVNFHTVDDPAILERDLGYAKRIGLNSTRIWLSYRDYERDPQAYITRLRNYIRSSHQLGFSTMPILFNGNGLDPDTLKPEFRRRGNAYVKAIVEAIKDEPGLLMWDIMNEPLTNNYYGKASAGERPQREMEITSFIRYYLSYVKKLDPVNAATVGYNRSSQMEPTAGLVDVLSFHEYTPLRSTIEQSYLTAEEISKKFGNKPILNTETGCIARANPYDVVLQISQEHKTGWYLFNLMIEGYWAQIHGIFYPDGTVRDPFYHRSHHGLL
jgi:endo-1,4-beta-mannosidase